MRLSAIVLAAAALALAALAPAARAGNATVMLYRHSSLDRVNSRAVRNVAYYGIFELGSPPQQYTGCFDTGSADTWVPAAACTNPACMTHARFEPRSSSTYQTLNAPFQITYGTGSVAGFVGSDMLTLGSGPSTVRVANQGFGVVFDSSMDFLSASCDGLFGLAFPELSEMQVNPAFFNMMRQDVLDRDLFALWLSPSPTQEPAGALTFGHADPDHYAGPVTWIPVTEKAYWTVPLGGATVGGRTVPLAARGAILDSGTTAILMSDADSTRLHQSIPGLSYNAQGGYYVVKGGCDAVSSLPDISFVLGGQPYAVPARLWTQAIPATTSQGGGSGGTMCISGIIPGGDSNSIILGDNFLRAWYTIYKYDKASHTASVGIAAPKAAKLTPKGKETAVQAVLPEGAAAAAAGRGASSDGGAATQAAEDDAPASGGGNHGNDANERGIRIGPITLTPRGVRIGPSGGAASADAAAAPKAPADPATPVSRKEAHAAPKTTHTSMSDAAAGAAKATSMTDEAAG